MFHLFHQLFLDLYTVGIFFINVNETDSLGLDNVLPKSMSFTEPQNVTLFENMVIADVNGWDDMYWSRAGPLSNVSDVLVRS